MHTFWISMAQKEINKLSLSYKNLDWLSDCVAVWRAKNERMRRWWWRECSNCSGTYP